jgi:hypothetical protein
MGGRVLWSGESESGVRTKRLTLSGKPSSEACRLPTNPVTWRTSSFGRPVLLAAAGPLGALLGCEELVGRQRALYRQQPLQVLGQRRRQLERVPAPALVRDGQLDSGAPEVSDVHVSDCRRRRVRTLASTPRARAHWARRSVYARRGRRNPASHSPADLAQDAQELCRRGARRKRAEGLAVGSRSLSASPFASRVHGDEF